MSRIAKSCFLQCVKNPTKKINLPHSETIYLGRNETCKITDKNLSRKQVAATANYNNYSVVIETNGTNYSGCNGYALRKGGTYHLKHGDQLELLLGSHEFNIMFYPEPAGDSPDNNVEPDSKRFKPNNYSIFNISSEKTVSTNNSDVNGKGLWESIDNGELLIYTCSNVKAQPKIAGFDLDGTLVKTKSGARFAKNSDDWTFNFNDVPRKLNGLYEDNYKIVIFTNQGGVKTEKSKVEELKAKVEGILTSLKVPIQVFAATTKSIYRKPAPGMWHALAKEKNEGVEIDITNSFYVGDAAGRDKNWAPKKNKDHSIGDRLFALNLDLRFYTPEEYFLGARAVPYTMPKFDPRDLKIEAPPALGNTCEVILMVGGPASGKSHFCNEYLVKHGYVYANRDILGSWQACVKVLEKALQRKQSVVIDNTNQDKTTRKRYIDVAKKNSIPCRCFVMSTSIHQCKHNNRFRELTDKKHALVGEVVLNMYKKNFEEPSTAEGFDEIVEVQFIPKFDTDETEKLYKMFLMES